MAFVIIIEMMKDIENLRPLLNLMAMFITTFKTKHEKDFLCIFSTDKRPTTKIS